MTNPIAFPSKTTHLSLPLLFVGQAQKEPFINQAFSLIDGLVTGIVNDSMATPPADPQEGASFRILEGATGDWAGHDNAIVLRIGGAWEFVTPYNGMTSFDQAAGVRLYFYDAWQKAAEPTLPSGGATIDVEARSAVSELVDALRAAGVFEKPA
ncbi:DUF2793 domain-containing protein [uncultured Erythrobacter sp.]|uniref:DUF2793 domain-containing protein n=1 Tax=uncultured Erythrobacter sp. TaxID=263913 RepID=UPI00260A6890|nr:DUF2793 domain-containing protein [uncultured Erythrobacter sp.]